MPAREAMDFGWFAFHSVAQFALFFVQKRDTSRIKKKAWALVRMKDTDKNRCGGSWFGWERVIATKNASK